MDHKVKHGSLDRDSLDQGSRAGSSLPHGGLLFSSISSSSGVSQSSGNLAVLGQVQGGDLLGLLDLLLVAPDLALQLVNEALHPLVVLLVLVTSEGQLLDGPLGLAEVLHHIGVAPGLSIQLRLQLTDASLHLDHGLPAALQSVHLGLVSPGSGVLALGLQQLPVLLKGHGQLLLTAELVSQPGGINHSPGGLVLGELGLVGHLVQVSGQLVELRLELPPGSSDGLVDVAEVSQVLVGVGQLLFSSTSLSVSSLQQSPALLQSVLHGGGLPVSGDLGVSSSGLGLGLIVNLDLSVPHLQLVLLDGGLSLSVAGNGVLQGESQVSGVGLQLLLHPVGLSLALGLSLQGGLHGVKSLGLVLPHHGELLVLLSNAALNLSLHLAELHLHPQDLVLLLLKGGLGLLQGRLQLHLLSLKTLADFVNLVDGAAAFGDLVHDVLDLIGQSLVLSSHFLQLENGLLVSRLHLEQLRGGISGLLLAHIKVEGETVNLTLHLIDGLVELLGLPLHGSVDNLGLVQVGGHLVDLNLNLALGLLNLGQLSLQVINSSLSLSVPGGKFHLGHLQFLSLSNGLLLVLLSHCSSVTLSLSIQSQDVLTTSDLLVKSFLGSVKLVLEVPVFTQEKLSLPGLVVTQSLHVIQLGGQGRLGLSQHVQIVLEVSHNSQEFSILIGNLVLGHAEVSESEVGGVDLLVGSVECIQQILVRFVSRGLAPHHLFSGGPGVGNLSHDDLLVLLNLGLHLAQSVDLLLHLQSCISLLSLQVTKNGGIGNVGLFNILAELHNLSLALLVELHLGDSGSAGLVVSLTQLLNLPGEVRPLPLSLSSGLTLSLQLLLGSLNTGLQLLDILLGLGHQGLLVIKLSGQHLRILLLVSDHVLNVSLLSLKISNSILSHL